MANNFVFNPDDEFIFRETHYARHGYERTNIYGLATLDSRLPTFLDRPNEFPSTRIEKMPDTTLPDAPPPLSRSVRHLFSASTTELTTFIAGNGYWNGLCIDLGVGTGKIEVIAIDAVEQYCGDNIQLLIAMAVAEKVESDHGETQTAYSLRIFGNGAFAKPFLEQTLFSIGESTQAIALKGAPMQISHVVINYKEHQQMAFILSTTDGVLHFYAQHPHTKQFDAVPAASYFPMLGRISDLQLKILVMHIYDRPNGERVICAGGQQGEVFLGFYDGAGVEVKSHAIRAFSPITSVLVFQPRVSKTVQEDDELHLVVTCAIEQAIVYRSLETNGLTQSRVLPQSGLYDSVLCSHVMDVDWDGQMEILIGTYGRQVLIYKQVTGTQDYNVLWKRQFAYPIYRMTHLDLNRDGLDELIVTTMYGVHIFQPDMKKAKERLLKVLQFIEDNRRRKYEMLLKWHHQKELEKAIVFEP